MRLSRRQRRVDRNNPFAGIALALEFDEVLVRLIGLRETQRCTTRVDGKESVAKRTADRLRGAARSCAALASEMILKSETAAVHALDQRVQDLFDAAVAETKSAVVSSDSLIIDRIIFTGLRRPEAALLDHDPRRAGSGDWFLLARALHELGDIVELYPVLYVEQEARRLRDGPVGSLPNLALHHLLEWAHMRGVGNRALARAVVAKGIIDDKSWIPTKIAPSIVERAVAEWEARLKRNRSTARHTASSCAHG